MRRNRFLMTGCVLAMLAVAPAGVAPNEVSALDEAPASDRAALSPLPTRLPDWMTEKKRNAIFRERGVYNDAVYRLERLARDLNAVAVGHAMAYEDIAIGKAAELETKTFDRINWVLNHPPRFMPDETNLSPTFGREYGLLEQVFDWTHILHTQTLDVLASPDLSDTEKDHALQARWRHYAERVPHAISPLPMNMGYLDGQPYSGAFRRRHPKVNGLFWGYHWLQGSLYDTLRTGTEQKAAYDVVGDRYHAVELYRTDRPFMPMFAETSPRFAERFPHIANTFDNLHMLHDMVNDILVSDGMTEDQKKDQILRAIWLVSASAHEGERPGDVETEGGAHDHRHMPGIPGMGWMKETPQGHKEHAPKGFGRP
jgi:hypothetical protein